MCWLVGVRCGADDRCLLDLLLLAARNLPGAWRAGLIGPLYPPAIARYAASHDAGDAQACVLHPRLRPGAAARLPGTLPARKRRGRPAFRATKSDRGKAPEGARFGWGVTARIEGAEVTTGLEVLYWADIRAGGDEGRHPQDLSGARADGLGVLSARAPLFRLMRLRKGPVIAALYPVAVLIAQLGLAALVGHVAGLALSLSVRPDLAGLRRHRFCGADRQLPWSAFGIAGWLVFAMVPAA